MTQHEISAAQKRRELRNENIHGNTEPVIGESALRITIGQRLARAAGPMPNIKGDRPPELESDRFDA